MTSNGTFYAASSITDVECVNYYADMFESSFTAAVHQAQRAIKYGQMCSFIPSAAESIALQPGNIHLVAISKKV